MSTATSIESKESHEQASQVNKTTKDDEYVPYMAKGYHSLTTYFSLPMHQTLKAIEWYKQAFGATEIFKLMCKDGKQVMHAELQFGTSRFMLSDADPRWDSAPYSVGSAMSMCFYTPDVDALYARALKAGAKSKRPPNDMFYGDRQATVIDPFGVNWTLMTHIKDVSDEEMQRLGHEMECDNANGKDGSCGMIKESQINNKVNDGEYVPYIANGYHSLTTYLCLPMHQTLKAIDWYKQAFGVSEIFKLICRDGKQVMHAELQFGTSRFMLSDADPRWDSTPYSVGSAMSMCFYTPDVDALYNRAIKAGAKSKRSPEDMFWGDRHATVIDPFGVNWTLMTHMKDVSDEEMQRLGHEMECEYANGKDGVCGNKKE